MKGYRKGSDEMESEATKNMIRRMEEYMNNGK